jgi:hypothetical protein
MGSLLLESLPCYSLSGGFPPQALAKPCRQIGYKIIRNDMVEVFAE